MIAADVAVCPTVSGDGSGSDWSNCMALIPTAPTRGDTYWLSDGEYGWKTIQKDVAGEAWIYIKKATTTSHGPATGWSDSLGDGTAVFTGIEIQRNAGVAGGYVEIDGYSSYGTLGCGIVLSRPLTSTSPFQVNSFYIGSGGHVILKYVEITFTTEWTGDDTMADGVYVTGGSNYVFDHVYVHDVGRNSFTLQVSDCTISNSVIRGNHSSVAIHGQGIQNNGGSNWVIKNNWFQDIEGTAVIATGVNGDGNITDWSISNNVFYNSSGRGGVGHGIFTTNTSTPPCRGLRFYNNTIVNYHQNNYARLYVVGPHSDNEAKNNLWYCKTTAVDNPTGACVTAQHVGIDIVSNNWYSNSITHNIESNHYGDTTNPFEDYDYQNFRLVGGSSAIDVGADLGVGYNLDIIGLSRPQGLAWDIGAYEYTPNLKPNIMGSFTGSFR